MAKSTKKVEIDGKELIFETGQMARQANGAVIVHCNDTTVFSSACAAKEPNLNFDFFPLQIMYTEKFSSKGKTLGGYLKREGRPTQREILTSRLIDRPLRPMFQKGYFNEVQVLSYVLSYDGLTSPEPLALCAASAALTISDIPLIKPVAGVRVGMIDNKFIINPTTEEQKESILDLLLAGTEDAVLMIEGYCDFLTEEQVLSAIETGHQAIQKICHALKEWQDEIGKEKVARTLRLVPEELSQKVAKLMQPDLSNALNIGDKLAREEAIDAIKAKVKEALTPEGEEPKYEPFYISTAIKKTQAKVMRDMILEKGVRSDGRKSDEIRPIQIEQSFLPRTHGSSLFTRGETQALAVTTLGGENMAQRFETIDEDGKFRFYLQYSFPPFSVGEVGRCGPPGRREIGHGKLAERALESSIPSLEQFPYTIRLESNIMESNGSSSMATVCGGCLAMMDAGVPIKRPVSGIAMGLILEGDQHVILSDILGIEDALGDMDFKITGDGEGITAFQMDIKVEGITIEIMKGALNQAKAGRVHILNKMLEASPAHRTEMSQYAPRIEMIKVKPSKIGMIIGPGGKQIRAITEETGAEVNIDDDGNVSISSDNPEGLKKAKEIIEGITAEAEIGKVYEGKVTSVKDFGAFVEILPGKEGLCHISEFDFERVEKMSDVTKEGDMISVKVLDVDDRGKIRLSRKATLKREKQQA